jgi:RNA polymerase sigma-70 factor (ECF subfamily)
LSSILQQIAAGDQSAVARCLDEYGGLVWSLASRYLRAERSEIEDAVQEVFVSVWTSASRYDPAKGSEAAFVATIARRRLIDHRRRLASNRTQNDPTEAAALVEVRPGHDEVERLGRDFGNLPEDERTALWLAVSRGLSHREIATATRSPIGTVKTRLRRAVMRLQELWGVGKSAANAVEEMA